MGKTKNILFIMCDQLRWDYLSCAGHPRLETPNIDALAAKGVRFTHAYCQAPVCGGSRMSFYTGRYAFTHGAVWNGVPLSVDELTLGDYLRPLGHRVALVGKTHMVADRGGMERLKIDRNSIEGVLVAECGFEPYERDDGLWGTAEMAPENLAYNNWLREQGYGGPNPWHDFANSAEGPGGEILSGWYLRNSKYPARVKEEHSETAYMTGRAMQFIDECGEAPWTMHLSYIKPHWPYIAPAPYHDMFGGNDILPANRHPKELETDHPIYRTYHRREDCQAFSRDEVRETVIPAYMGLIKQIDDHLGRLFAFMEEKGRMDDTMIVFTSDHGDYLGDHWLGEKELFHEESIRLPFIVYDPDPASDATRGTADGRFIESIDLVPTFIEAAGGTVPEHIVEGKSLLPLLHGEQPGDWRDYVICESEFASRIDLDALGIAAREARAVMIRTAKWKYIHHLKFRPELYDLEDDPNEFTDLGADPAYEEIRSRMREMLTENFLARNFRTTVGEEPLARRGRAVYYPPEKRRVYIGVW